MYVDRTKGEDKNGDLQGQNYRTYHYMKELGIVLKSGAHEEEVQELHSEEQWPTSQTEKVQLPVGKKHSYIP